MLNKFERICRLCSKNYTELFSLYECDNHGISYEEKLQTICGIKINSEDVYPKNICKYCNKKLDNSYEFRNMCLNSMLTFSKLLEDDDQTVENEDVYYYLEVDEDWLAENKLTKASLGLPEIHELEPEIQEPPEIIGKNPPPKSQDEKTKTKKDDDWLVENNLTKSSLGLETPENPEIIVKKPPPNPKNQDVSSKTKTKKCRVCKKRFNTETKVKLHMQRIHKEIYLSECKVSCYKCGMKFQHMRNLKRHMVYHNITYSYFECNFCEKKLYSKKSWRKHIKIHDKTINEICKICNKRLNTSVGKIYHMDYHRTKQTLTNKTYYSCYSCGLDLTSFEALEAHLANMHDDEIERNFEKIFNEKQEKLIVFRCNLCSLFFEKLPELKHHVAECFAKIDQPKSFMCDTCGKCFKSSWLLNNHKAGHSSQRKFICDICGQRFKWHNDLTNHVARIHENIRPYVCKFCGKTCGTSATLKSHLRSHSKERPYTCHICNTSFAQNSSLKEHMFKHTGGQEGSCPVCNKVFKTPLRLRTHMKRHNTQRVLYPCDLCGRMFTEKSSVKKHKIKIHNDQNENIE